MTPAPGTRIAVLTDLHVAEAGTPDSRWIGTLPLGRSQELVRAPASGWWPASPRMASHCWVT